MQDSLLYELALCKIPHVGPVIAKALISYCGSAESVFNSSKKHLLNIPNVGAITAEHILKANPHELANKELEFIERNNINVIRYLDKAYPQRLLQYDYAPLILYTNGTMDLNSNRHVGIIGTRKPSQYGKQMSQTLVKDLIAYQVNIISGLAYGIDTVAHQSAVKHGIQTIGVLGHGLDRIYPSENKTLARQMMNHGGVITEFPSTTKPDATNFPMRNRIIAALSDAVVVIESGKKGGSVITANFANQYHKDVFAFPGKITDAQSEGCNNLIKQHKASLIQSAKDVAYIMRWEKDDDHVAASKQTSLFVNLTDEENQVIKLLKGQEGMGLDDIHITLKKPLGQLAGILLKLECEGLIKSLPGKRYASVY